MHKNHNLSHVYHTNQAFVLIPWAAERYWCLNSILHVVCLSKMYNYSTIVARAAVSAQTVAHVRGTGVIFLVSSATRTMTQLRKQPRGIIM